MIVGKIYSALEIYANDVWHVFGLSFIKLKMWSNEIKTRRLRR